MNYLNSKPLVEGLAEAAPYLRVTYDLPSRLADALAEDRLDVALLPVFELFRQPDWQIVSDACVACRGPVWSVKLLFRVPPAEVRTLDLDEGSRTSAALAQVLLRRQFGLKPKLGTLPIGSGIKDSTADAVLLIGDRAMFEIREPCVEVWDLGERWWQWTGLPFVFAAWIARSSVDLSLVSPELSAARDRGLTQTDAIVDREAGRLGLEKSLAHDYLRNMLRFRLRKPERRGLAMFYRQCVELSLVAPRKDSLVQGISVDDCTLVR